MKNKLFDRIRKPVPPPGRSLTSKKGKKGYDRKKDKKRYLKEIKKETE